MIINRFGYILSGFITFSNFGCKIASVLVADSSKLRSSIIKNYSSYFLGKCQEKAKIWCEILTKILIFWMKKFKLTKIHQKKCNQIINAKMSFRSVSSDV